jgi:peptidoglycan-associated lipoprotein
MRRLGVGGGDLHPKGLGHRMALGVAGGAVLLLAGCSTSGGPQTASRSQAAPLCQDITFPIYFAEYSDQLTPSAQKVLVTVATQVRGCRIGYVSVLGLTDAKGTPVDNLELSKRRAGVVAAALQSAGLPAPQFEVRGLGEVGALDPAGKSVPLRRKTEVAIHASPPA